MSDKLEAALHDGYPAATRSLVAAVRAQVKAERERDQARAVVARVVALRDHWKTTPNPAIPMSSLGLMLAVVGDLTDALDGVS